MNFFEYVNSRLGFLFGNWAGACVYHSIKPNLLVCIIIHLMGSMKGCEGKLAVVIAEVLLTLSVRFVFVVSSLSLSVSTSSGSAGSQQAPLMIYLFIKLTIIPAVIGTIDSVICDGKVIIRCITIVRF